MQVFGFSTTHAESSAKDGSFADELRRRNTTVLPHTPKVDIPALDMTKLTSIKEQHEDDDKASQGRNSISNRLSISDRRKSLI